MIQDVKVCPACSREYGNEHHACPADGVLLVAIDTDAGDRGENLIGQVVGGRYRLERVVGRGGMGTVYACRHVVVGKTFAMKVLRPGIERSEEILQRFIREAQAANSIGSRHICEVTDFGQLDNGAFYVVMELIEGVSLTRALREGRLSAPEIQHIFVQIADTLEKAHQRGIIHRDLKPDNVLLLEDEGDRNFAKLLDFGIAKMIQAEASNLTETGVILGTPYYMSPEQARGDPVDHRSDIYALGVMMYRAFTGRLPFMADTAMGVLTRHLTEVPEAPSSIGNVDSRTEQVILRCMEKKPIDRFQSMADVAAALRACTGPVAHGRDRPTVDESSGRELRRALDDRLAAEGIAVDDGTTTSTWGPGGPPSDALQTAPRLSSGAVVPSASQPGFSPTPSDPRAVAEPIETPGPGAILAASADVAAPQPHPEASGGAAPTPASPWPPLPSTSSPSTDGAPRDMQVEAFTARGLVSPRLDTGTQRGGSARIALWAGAVTAMMLLGGASAFVLLSPTGTPEQVATGEPAAVASTESAGRGAAGGSAPEVSGSPTDGEPETARSAELPTPDAGPSSATPAPSTPPATPGPGPAVAPLPGPKPAPPPTATEPPRPEIRSPFE